MQNAHPPYQPRTNYKNMKELIIAVLSTIISISTLYIAAYMWSGLTGKEWYALPNILVLSLVLTLSSLWTADCWRWWHWHVILGKDKDGNILSTKG